MKQKLVLQKKKSIKCTNHYLVEQEKKKSQQKLKSPISEISGVKENDCRFKKKKTKGNLFFFYFFKFFFIF